MNDQHGKGAVVRGSEIQYFGAFGVWRHGANAHVPAALPFAADDGFPARRRQFQLCSQFLRYGISNVYIESNQLVFIVEVAKWRIVIEQHVTDYAGLFYPVQRAAGLCSAEYETGA